jgi:protein associated with RNAse G/E
LGQEWKEAVISDEITVSVRKYDGREHRRWRARVAKREGTLLILDAVFEEEIEHGLLGTIALGTVSTEYYWLDRWYNVFRFSDSSGQLKSFYCNINEPPSFDGHVLSYIDLDIDVLVAPDLTYKILDLDDFEANAKAYAYPDDVQANAHGALKELSRLIDLRAFPFND